MGSLKGTFGAIFGLLCLFQTELPAQTSSNDVPSPGASWRIELDTLGEVRVPADRLWGAQTERARQNFQIGMPTFVWSRSVIHAMGLVKLCAAEANRELALFDGGPGALSRDLVDAMITAAREVSEGKWEGEFPLAAFQTGSGTQTHMNANEVIANRATQIARGTLKGARPIHPNDHVNKGQSSNDVFPTVMHVATVTELQRTL
jgi:fumarate hydratase class II